VAQRQSKAYLIDLDKAVAELANTWKPDDPD
jgi:hypothetical protein